MIMFNTIRFLLSAVGTGLVISQGTVAVLSDRWVEAMFWLLLLLGGVVIVILGQIRDAIINGGRR